MSRYRPPGPLLQAAALARIAELGRSTEMTGPTEETTAQPSPWALGNYHRFAKATIWEVGPVLVDACGIAPGQHVLDVAAGSGNAAIRAAMRGAHVIASDVATENFDAGRAEADAHGVEVEWVEGDAQALPFADGQFDAVTSVFGAIFAPSHQQVADELVRVCRPGGVVGMTSFIPQGVGGAFFDLFARYSPPLPPGALPPLLWGDEHHVRRLFGDRVALDMTQRHYTERAASPEAYRDLFYETFGPVVAIRTSLTNDPDRAAAFDRDFLDFAVQSNSGPSDGPAEYRYEYLLVVGPRE